MTETTVFIVRRGEQFKLLRRGVEDNTAVDNTGRYYWSHENEGGQSTTWFSNAVNDRWLEVRGPTMFLKIEDSPARIPIQTLRVRLLFGGRPHRFQQLTITGDKTALDFYGRQYKRCEKDTRMWIGPDKRGLEWRAFPNG